VFLFPPTFAQDGDVDGFSVLQALLGAGFRLHRLNRVRLLRAVEEMGGKMPYGELCQVPYHRDITYS
jgi:hypothetical protein